MLTNKYGFARSQTGFSLIEIIIAIAIFSIIIAGGLTGFIPILNQNRQANEILQANRLAEEGLEAVRSIRDRDFSLLTAGNKGIGISNNLWNFSGTSDTNDKFTHQISITTANRDAGGTLISSGGTTDPDTWLVKSSVTWNYSVGETKQFSLDTILTNWRKNIGVTYEGLIVYSDGTVNPPWRSYNSTSNTYSIESTVPSLVGSPRSFIIKTSSQKTEAIAGTVTSNGVLYIYCFNGTTWTQDWSATVGGGALTRRFDIAYETNSGKAVVLYSTNTGTNNELNFRTKNSASACGGTSWSGATNYNPIRTSGTVQWVKMSSDPRSSSNIIAALWADSASDLSASIWNGSTFQNEPSSVTESSLEVVSIAQDVDDFDLAYESISGDLMLIWANSIGGNGTNGVRYRTCTGGTTTCTWNAITTPPTFSDDATNLDLSANTNSDQMVFASIGNAGSDLQIGYWNGTSWSNTNNADTSCETPLAGTKLVAIDWLISGSTTRSVVVYNHRNITKISWFTGNGSTFTRQPDATVVPNITNPQKWYEIAVDPKNKNQLMLLSADVNVDLYAKRLIMTATPTFTWTNSDASSPLEINLNQGIVNPFGFAYWQK